MHQQRALLSSTKYDVDLKYVFWPALWLCFIISVRSIRYGKQRKSILCVCACVSQPVRHRFDVCSHTLRAQGVSEKYGNIIVFCRLWTDSKKISLLLHSLARIVQTNERWIVRCPRVLARDSIWISVIHHTPYHVHIQVHLVPRNADYPRRDT